MPKVKFGDVVKEVKNKIDRNNNPYEYYVAGDHMDSEDLTIHRRGCFATDDVGPAFIREFRKGQVLYGSRRTYLKKVAVADFDGVTSNTTFVLETKDPQVLLQELLPFIMLTDNFTKWSIGKSKGSTNPYILFSDLADYEFDLPSIEEQKKLAAVLWKMFRLKEGYVELQHQSDLLVQSQFIEMFGDYLSEDRMSKLESCCDCFCDGDWIESKDQSESGIRLIQTGNVGTGDFLNKGERSRFISEDTFSRLNCTEVLEGDILISRLPDPIGRACIVPGNLGKSITAVDCTIIRLKKTMLPNFLIAYTKTNVYMAQIDSFTTGSTRKRISRGNLGSIAVPVPKIELQRRFCELVEQFDKSKSLCELTAQNQRMGGVRCA